MVTRPPGSWITVQTPVSSTTSTIPVERYQLSDHDALPTVAQDPVPEGDTFELNAEGNGDVYDWYTQSEDNATSPSRQDRPVRPPILGSASPFPDDR
eukprot:9471821-Pyramimonas_sp.AAC.1